MTDTGFDQWPLRRGSLIYPTPVAVACGRVLRARTAAERVNACLKAAEVLTRYLAAVAVASFASRDETAEATLTTLSGNLSFGHFLTTVQEVASTKGNHPASSLLAQGFKQTKQNKKTVRGETDAALVALLELRNGDGHDLRNLDEAKAVSIELRHAPLEALLTALEGVDALLSRPLFVVESQEWTREAIVLQRLMLMGESDPTPESVKVTHEAGVEATRAPYVAINKRCLQLPPWLLWGIDQERQNFSLLFLDGVADAYARYRTLDGGIQQLGGGLAGSVRDICSGTRRDLDVVVLLDGRHLAREWGEVRQQIVENGRLAEGKVDWQSYDDATLAWYANRLEPGCDDAQTVICERLLDGRARGLDPGELKQLTLLFGKEQPVRLALGRDMYDFRVAKQGDARWDERMTGTANLLTTLRCAVDFFAKNVGLGADLEGDLSKTHGSADYIAMREALVNQLIHQDYADRSAPTQIELTSSRATFFNTGHSLVAEDQLTDGGRSQSRNPLIARALRLIGYAELAGSGLRILMHEWRIAKRRPPVFHSDCTSNTFSLTLDWSEVRDAYDEVWKERLGVRLSETQAAILNLAADPAGITARQAAVGAGITLAEAQQALKHLVKQVLLSEDDGGQYHLQPHLEEVLQ